VMYHISSKLVHAFGLQTPVTAECSMRRWYRQKHCKITARSGGAMPIRVGFSHVKFRVAAQLAGSLGKAAKFRSLYDIGKSNLVAASGL